MDFFDDNHAQISVEMIIVLAALIGVAIIVIKKLTESVSKSTETLDAKGDQLNKEIEELGN